MPRKRPDTILYRRKREGRTSYSKRLKLLLSRKPRIVVRLTNNTIIAQCVLFLPQGDQIAVAVNSQSLLKLGWKYSYHNTSAAYLTGLLFGKKMSEKGITEGILDTGLRTPLHKSKLYAFLKGILDAGVSVPFKDESIFPDEERISGNHIQKYAEKLRKENKDLYESQFAQYLKNNELPEKMPERFKEVKKKLMG